MIEYFNRKCIKIKRKKLCIGELQRLFTAFAVEKIYCNRITTNIDLKSKQMHICWKIVMLLYSQNKMEIRKITFKEILLNFRSSFFNFLWLWKADLIFKISKFLRSGIFVKFSIFINKRIINRSHFLIIILNFWIPIKSNNAKDYFYF